jgi:hypothetical protein
MRYDVVVALVFETERTDENRYDVWDIHTPVEADGPKKALLDAIALTKSVEDWRMLGYPDAPVLCGVRSVHSGSRLGEAWEKALDQSRLPILVGTINEQQVRSLQSFKKIQLPYYIMDFG